MDNDGIGLELRRDFYNCLGRWEREGLIAANYDSTFSGHLYWLLRGKHGHFDPLTSCTPAEIELLRGLVGPNGYAIYRMLLARREG